MQDPQDSRSEFGLLLRHRQRSQQVRRQAQARMDPLAELAQAAELDLGELAEGVDHRGVELQRAMAGDFRACVGKGTSGAVRALGGDGVVVPGDGQVGGRAPVCAVTARVW